MPLVEPRPVTIAEWLAGAPFPWPSIETRHDGDLHAACYYVSGVELLRTRHEKPYLRLRLEDRNGTVDGRVWEDAEEVHARVAPGSYLGVRGRVQVYQGRHQLRIEELATLRVAPDELGLFLPRSPRSAAEMEEELERLFGSVRDAALRELLRRVLGPDTPTGRAFRVAPAAKHNHHAYIGGLMEHTLSVAGLCDAAARHYGAGLDRDLLVTGALLHDIGKTREISADVGFEYTTEGKLLGHIVLGIQVVAEEGRRIPELSRERLDLVLHLIASHQGRYEWQSPREPATLEALVLHYVDDLDAKLAQARALLDSVEQGWTAYDRSFGRDFLRHLREAPAAGADGGPGGVAGGEEPASAETGEIPPSERAVAGPAGRSALPGAAGATPPREGARVPAGGAGDGAGAAEATSRERPRDAASPALDLFGLLD